MKKICEICKEEYAARRPIQKVSPKCRRIYINNYYVEKRANRSERDRRKEIENKRKIREKTKIAIFDLLGNQCSNPNCPIPKDKLDRRALQIDHIHGGGVKTRRESSSDRYIKILKEIRKGSKEYQMLCVYCNWMKRYYNMNSKEMVK